MPSISPEVIVITSLAASVAGGAVGAVGAIQSGNAQKAAANYNSQVATEDATLAQQNATMAAQSGEAQVGQQQQKTRAYVGAVKANQAARGVDVNSGSAVDVRSSAAELGELDAINIRANAARTAYGYDTQAAGFKGQSQLDVYEGEQAVTAGEIGAGSTILGSVGSAGSNFANFQAAHGRGGGGPMTYQPPFTATDTTGGF